VFVDNQTLATGGSDNRIHIWDLNSRVVIKTLVGHTGSVAALACDGTGATLVSGSYDTTVRVWNLRGPTEADSVARSPGESTR
jgi:WD40 repeat protein